jgi:hypothetical protein
MMPHMHRRGKEMTHQLMFSDGRKEIALRETSCNFDWQIAYDVATLVALPEGTKVRVDATSDNSPARRGNRDPAVDVYGGTRTCETMNPWFGVVIDRWVDPGTAILTRAAQGGG